MAFRPHRCVFLLVVWAWLSQPLGGFAADPLIATQAINDLGLRLYRLQPAGQGNLLLSPYSLQCALAMSYAGAAGETRAEMQKALRYPSPDRALHESLAEVTRQLEAATKDQIDTPRRKSPAFTWQVANRLFGQIGHEFRPEYLSFLRKLYGAELEPMDFRTDPAKAAEAINRWVEEKTNQRIRELVRPENFGREHSLTLVNALHLQADWEDPFKGTTNFEPFLVDGKTKASVMTMKETSTCGYLRREGYEIVTRPFHGNVLQFVIVLPERPDGLGALEPAISPQALAGLTRLPGQLVELYLPKLKLAPDTLALKSDLKTLGLRSVFDEPKGSANFDGIAPKKPDDYLYFTGVVHRTFLELDENGIEAAAATASDATRGGGGFGPPPRIVTVRVNRPFFFAVQHRATGACLFLGRVTDPR